MSRTAHFHLFQCVVNESNPEKQQNVKDVKTQQCCRNAFLVVHSSKLLLSSLLLLYEFCPTLLLWLVDGECKTE